MSKNIKCYLCKAKFDEFEKSIQFCTACEHVFCSECYYICQHNDFCCHDDDDWKVVQCYVCKEKICINHVEDGEIIPCQCCFEVYICDDCKPKRQKKRVWKVFLL